MATSKKTPIDYLAMQIATACCAGYLPKAPGTAGAVVGVFIYLGMQAEGAMAYFPHAILLVLFAGTLAAHRVENFWGHDSQRIVIDEVVGQMIAFILSARTPHSGVSTFVGFVLFRLFDIAKPFPIRRLEKLPGGIGVMADDVGAGIYALGCLTLAQYLFKI